MAQVVASHSYFPKNSTQLTRTNSQSFHRADQRETLTFVDKHQARHLYRLQRAPNVTTKLHLDSSDTSYGTQEHSDNIIRQQVKGSSVQPIRTVYHRPTVIADKSIYTSAVDIFRHEEGSSNETGLCLTDRSILNNIGSNQPSPRNVFNSEESHKQPDDCLQCQYHLSSQPDLTYYNPGGQQRSMMNEIPHHYKQTSTQQDVYDETSRATYQVNGSDPLIKSPSHSSLYDTRTSDILKWDRVQRRNVHFYRKPIDSIASLPRAHQISGYSGSIGGYNLQDIDDPTVDFQPYTVLRTEQPKYSMHSSKANISSYAGNAHWTKVDPVSHYDQSGDAYTTTAAIHTSLPIDNTSYRHASLHGEFSKSVTNVMPYNPYNSMDNSSATTNGSLDFRPHLILRQLPRIKLPPAPRIIKKEEQPVTDEVDPKK